MGTTGAGHHMSVYDRRSTGTTGDGAVDVGLRPRRQGSTALRDSGGLGIRTSANEVRDALAEYLAKQLAVEATQGGQKEGKQHGRIPFQIAADFFETGDVDDLDLWREYEEVSEGRCQFTWSAGLREMAGLAAEQTDEEIAEDEAGDEDLLNLTAESWRVVRECSWELMQATSAGGLAGAIVWLDTMGLGGPVLPGADGPQAGLKSPSQLSCQRQFWLGE